MGDDDAGAVITRSWSGEREAYNPAVAHEPALVRVHSSLARVGEATPFGLADDLTVAGRRPIGDGIVLPADDRASRVHAGFARRDGVVVLENESRNGTWVNGRRVNESIELEDGAVVRMGDTLFVYRARWTVADGGGAPSIIGASPEAQALRGEVAALANANARVMLLGETGTGKEVLARALHDASSRAGKPFVAVNCASLQETLAASTLFGHKKGAFTGADETRDGAFHAADGGTLFLDELGELPAAVQPILLRALDGGEIQRVGEVKTMGVDVRVVSATNRDLGAGMRTGSFRTDLYARLNDVALHLPALARRREDVLLLLAHALPTERELSPDLAEALVMHSWPYNVREVFKLARELAIRGTGESTLTLPLISERLARSAADAATSAPPIAAGSPEEEQEEDASVPVPSREDLVALLTTHGGVLAKIARATGRSRRQIYRWLENHDLDPNDFRGP